MPQGLVDLRALQRIGQGRAARWFLIMLANNETGIIQPIPRRLASCMKRAASCTSTRSRGFGQIADRYQCLGLIF